MKKTKAKANVRTKVTYAPFEVADYLDGEEAIAEYLSLAARDENPGVLLKALGDVLLGAHSGRYRSTFASRSMPTGKSPSASFSTMVVVATTLVRDATS